MGISLILALCAALGVFLFMLGIKATIEGVETFEERFDALTGRRPAHEVAAAQEGEVNFTMKDIDLVEINEAFAAQVLPSAKHLEIPMEKLNIRGGGIALGHPFGMTGARIMTTLINGLQFENKQYGLESMCVGGGQGIDRKSVV